MARRDRRPGEAGFTLAEMMLAMVISVIVLSGVYGLLTGQFRHYGVQRAASDAAVSLRTAGAVLGWDLSQVAAEDLLGMGSDSIAVRSVLATGIVCSTADLSNNRKDLGLYELTGSLAKGSADSALVYLAGSNSWKRFQIKNYWYPSGAWNKTPTCFWGDSTTSMPRPQGAIRVKGSDVDDIEVGGGVWVVRPIVYGLFTQDGRWWLGRKARGGSTWETLAGPMTTTGLTGGLRFRYRDSSGSITSNPSEVATIEIAMETESVASAITSSSGRKPLTDEVSTLIYLRNNQ